MVVGDKVAVGADRVKAFTGLASDSRAG